MFTVPPGGGGLYYFYAHLQFYPDETGIFNIRHNGRHVCDIYEQNDGSGDWGMSSCGAVMVVEEGNRAADRVDMIKSEEIIIGSL